MTLVILSVVITTQGITSEDNNSSLNNNTTLNDSQNITTDNGDSQVSTDRSDYKRSSSDKKSENIKEDVTNKVNEYASQHEASDDIQIATSNKKDSSE